MNLVSTARNIAEVKLQIDKLARNLGQKSYSNSEIRKTTIQQDVAVINELEHQMANDPDKIETEGLILYVVLKSVPNIKNSINR